MKYFKDSLIYSDGKVKRADLSFGERIAGFYAGDEEIELPQGCVVLPGLIDEHVHGAGGSDVMDGTYAALNTVSETLAKEGVTAFLATTMTEESDKIKRALAAVKTFKNADTAGAEILGVHLEGPFISPAYRGAQRAENIARADIALFEEYDSLSGGKIRMVTVAPETEGATALIKHLSARGITASVGHSAATSAQVGVAIAAGATSVTHVFNAQSPFRHREIGVAGSALLCDGLTCELIADGIHVSYPAIKILFRCKPRGKIALISDGIRAKGLGDGESELGGQTVFVKSGEARLKDGTLAGSVLALNKAIENLVKYAGVEFGRAVDCATVNPAVNSGVAGDRGSIAVGKRADFCIMDGGFNVVRTYRGGKLIFER